MDRIFLDANVLFSAAYRADAGLLAFWKLRDAALCSSRYAIEEANLNLEEDVQRRRLARLTAALHVFDARECALPPGITLPPKDLPILLAAIERRDPRLVTAEVRLFFGCFGKTVEGAIVCDPA